MTEVLNKKADECVIKNLSGTFETCITHHEEVPCTFQRGKEAGIRIGREEMKNESWTAAYASGKLDGKTEGIHIGSEQVLAEIEDICYQCIVMKKGNNYLLDEISALLAGLPDAQATTRPTPLYQGKERDLTKGDMWEWIL